jgi:hypothetical protein
LLGPTSASGEPFPKRFANFRLEERAAHPFDADTASDPPPRAAPTISSAEAQPAQLVELASALLIVCCFLFAIQKSSALGFFDIIKNRQA